MSLLDQLATHPEFTRLATAWSRTVELGGHLAAGGADDLGLLTRTSTATGAARDVVLRYLNPGRMAAFDAARGALLHEHPAARAAAVATLHDALGTSAIAMAETHGYGSFMLASPNRGELATLLRRVGGHAVGA